MRIPTFFQFQSHAALIEKQFERMNILYQQASSQKKLLASSDDPVLANQIKSKENFISDMMNYKTNGVMAQNRSKLFLSSIKSAINVQTDVQAQIMKAQSGTLSPENRASLAEQLKGDLAQLLTLANSQEIGNYIYSGFNTTSSPYVLVNGRYEYQGDHNQSSIDIGPNASTTYYENGFHVFGDIFTGNGKFTVSANSANTGTAFTTPGSVIDASAYVADTYTVSFVTNSDGKLAYQVIGASSGQVIPPLPASIPADAPAYTPDSDIKFNGMSFHMSGLPKLGDTFTVAPSTQENVFNSLQDLITTLESSVTNQSIFNQKMSQFSVTFANISQHFIEYQSQMGTEAANIDLQIQNNETVLSNTEIALSGLSSIDDVQVFSAIMQKSLALQATQESYARLQETLLQLLRI